MSRYEGKLEAVLNGTDALPELLRLATVDALIPEEQRQAAIACYLSASDGWRDAGGLLGGAFAGEPSATPRSAETGLSGGKEA